MVSPEAAACRPKKQRRIAATTNGEQISLPDIIWAY
jgi:hypothetical protein